MKRLLALVLVAALSVGVLAGCKKNDDLNNDELGAIDDAIKNEEPLVDETPVVEEANDVEYIIYVRYKDKPYLYDEYRTIKDNDNRIKDKTIEEFVIQELVNYGDQGDFISAVPEGMKVLSVKKDGNNITVDLDEKILDAGLNHTDTIVGIGSIVNTLIPINPDYKVQILVGGQVIDKLSGVEVNKPLEFFEVLFPDK